MIWLAALTPMAGAAVIFMLPGSARRLTLATLSVVTVAASLAVTVAALATDSSAQWTLSPALVLTAQLVPLSAAVAIAVPAVALPVLVYAASHEPRRGLVRLVSLLAFFVGAMQLLVVADDLLTLLIGWELVGACSWALISHEWRDPDNPRGAAQAFLVTRSGDLGLFLAAMTAFAGTGTFAFDALSGLEGSASQVLAIGVLVSAAAKSAQLPLSMWLFRAMAGPSSASALLHAATMVAAGAYLLARLHGVLDSVAWFAPATIAIGLATALAGGLVAVLQPHAKKLLAASTSAHHGLMLVATGAGYPAVAIAHLITHAFFKSLLFMAAGVAGSARGTYRLGRLSLGRVLPFTTACAACGSVALAGVPPLGGAWSKDLIGAAAGHVSPMLAVGVMVAGALSACYAFRWQWLAFGVSADTGRRDQALDRPGQGTLAALAIPALVTLSLSLLWLPPAHEAAARWLDAALPGPKGWELTVAVLLVAAGLYAGRWLAARLPALGEAGRPAALAEWFGLPALLALAVTRPALALACHAARFDDRVVDAPARAVAATARTLGRRLAIADDAAVDAGVRRSARFGSWLAGVGSTFTEVMADGAVEGAARLVDTAGLDLRRLETGLAHHYLVWVAAGAVLMIAIVMLAG